MLELYGGLRAQIVTPVVREGRVAAIVSLHQLGRTRRLERGRDRRGERGRRAGGRAPVIVPRSSAHNRWHPALPPAATVAPGDEVTLECTDGIGGQLTRESTHADAGQLDLGLAHPLTGPVFVEGAEPGNVLEVEFVAYEPDDFGTTAVIPGFGFLADLFPEPYLVKWEIADGVARSEELPGVAVPQDMFAGVVGVAPSPERLAGYLAREEALRERGQPVADSMPEGAVPPEAADGAAHDPAARDGREHGHPPARRGLEALAAGRRAGCAVLDRRPPLRAGRRRGLRDGDRGRRAR